MMYYACLLLALLAGSAQAELFRIKNNAGGQIKVGIQGNPGHPHLEGGGFYLQRGQSRDVNAPDNWAGRFWPATWCDGNNHCQTGDCGNKVECQGSGGTPPATLCEITLKGSGGLDYYDISLVDGFNLPATFGPIGGQGDGGQYSCKKAQCTAPINERCPDELKLIGGNGNDVIGCKSACLRYNTDQYCCRGAYGQPDTCKSSTWPVNYPKFFKDQCPDAYSYAYDDHKSTFTCKASGYEITFG